jgi:hypothetical protein
MPGKLTPGTPSMSAGTSKPCQWIELLSSSSLTTVKRTTVPCFSRSSGAGTVPLIPIASLLHPSMTIF